MKALQHQLTFTEYSFAGMTENITVPDLAVAITFPILKDDGSLEVIKAFRVHHSHYKEPCKGGDCIFVYIYISVVLNVQAWMHGKIYDTRTVVKLESSENA